MKFVQLNNTANKKLPMAVIRRLPKYLRYLEELVKREVKSVSSSKLSEDLGFSASQVRHDFNILGYFGRQGYGYIVKDLYEHTKRLLGITKGYNTIIIGAGNIGQAIANYTNFDSLGFNLKCIFDINPKLINFKIRNIEINDIDLLAKFVSKNDIDIAILCTPKSVSQDICDILVKNGIKGIWNFTQVDLNTPKEVVVENVHLSDNLLTLSCLIQ